MTYYIPKIYKCIQDGLKLKRTTKVLCCPKCKCGNFWLTKVNNVRCVKCDWKVNQDFFFVESDLLSCDLITDKDKIRHALDRDGFKGIEIPDVRPLKKDK